MKSSSLFRTALVIAALFGAGGLMRADTITLKSGDVFSDAKILSETPDSITFQYKLTPHSLDTKTLAKTDIKTITRQSPAEVAFQEKGLGKILPTADLMTAADYEAIIQDKLHPFAEKYKGTKEAAEVEKIITALSEDKKKVLAGEIKVEGRWLDSKTAKQEAYNVEAFGLRHKMNTIAATPGLYQYRDAMRIFDVLKSKYPVSLQYVQAIPEAIDILNKYVTQLDGLIRDQPRLQKSRDDGIKGLSSTEATSTKSAILREEQEYKRTLDEQTKSKIKVVWKDIYPYDLVGLKDALKTAEATLRDLKAIDLDALRKDNEMYMAVIHYIADGNIESAQSALAQVTKEASQSTLTTTTNPMIKVLQNQLDDLKKAREAANIREKQQKTIQAPTAADTTVIQNQMQKINDDLEKKKKDQEAKDKKDKAAKAEAEAKKKLAALPPPPPEEESFLTKYGIYLGGALAVVLGALLYMNKKKKDED